jgi:ketosteroid isomerase-like protein
MSAREDILALLLAGFCATDRGDYEAKGRFFSADAVMYHGDGQEVRGVEALSATARDVVGQFVTTHSFANTDIVVHGDEAEAVTHAIAHVVVDGGRRLLVRGLRYEDRLALTASGWRITQRRHQVLWQHEALTVDPRSPAEYSP